MIIHKQKDTQSGHAALLFVLFFPLLFGVFVLGTDGSRALQDKARLEEAVEIATLAVAAENSSNQATQEATATKFIQSYFPQSLVSSVSVAKIACEQNPKCDQNNPDVQRFFEYQVNVTLSQDSWFYSEDSTLSNMGETYTVGGSSNARKYQSEAVDVILVADYSASMFGEWDGGDEQKFKDLNDIMIEVAEELEKFNGFNVDQKNKLAVVGFDFYTSEGSGSNRRFAHHIICSGGCNNSLPGNNGVDAPSTVNNIFNLGHASHQYTLTQSDVTNISIFETIPLTDNFTNLISKINNLSFFNVPGPGGSGTSSYAGLMKAAQIAIEGKNPRRIIIILSDGADWFSTTTTQLINAGLCTTILDTLNEETTADGKEVKARLAAVGFDYDIDANPQMKNCVGESNVYKAENREEIKNRILELISEEIGRLVL